MIAFRTLIVLAALALAPPASALLGAGSSTIDRAAQHLATSPVYVDPRAGSILSPADAARVGAEISGKNAGPMYIAVLPASALDAAGGDASGVLNEIVAELGRPGTYAVIVGHRFRARSQARSVPPGKAAAVLLDFVDRVGATRKGGGGGPSGVLLVAIVAAAGGILFLVFSASRGRAASGARRRYRRA